jgi:hypothetical protein
VEIATNGEFQVAFSKKTKGGVSLLSRITQPSAVPNTYPEGNQHGKKETTQNNNHHKNTNFWFTPFRSSSGTSISHPKRRDWKKDKAGYT